MSKINKMKQKFESVSSSDIKRIVGISKNDPELDDRSNQKLFDDFMENFFSLVGDVESAEEMRSAVTRYLEPASRDQTDLTIAIEFIMENGV